MSDGFSIDATDFAAAAVELGASDELIGRAAEPMVDAWADAVQRATITRARPHKRTGRLERNVRRSRIGADIARRDRVELTGLVAPILVRGSSAHVIRPIRAHALHLVGHSPGARGFAEGVRHPGTTPDPILARGVRDASADLEATLARGASRLADELAASVEG